jgi:hypothetical protein
MQGATMRRLIPHALLSVLTIGALVAAALSFHK